MSVRRQRLQRAEAELALQQALDRSATSGERAMQPLRRHWPAWLVGGGLLLGWLLERSPRTTTTLAPAALLGQAIGLLPLLLRLGESFSAARAAAEATAQDAARAPTDAPPAA